MKLKIFLITILGVVGLGSSIALADGGRHNDGNQTTTTGGCSHVELRGTLAPQTFTVTVQKAEQDGGLAPGQVVTVSVGGTGDTVRLSAEGCANGSLLNARGAELRVWTGEGHHHGNGDGDGRHGATTTTTTTTAATTTTTTTTGTNG